MGRWFFVCLRRDSPGKWNAGSEEAAHFQTAWLARCDQPITPSFFFKPPPERDLIILSAPPHIPQYRSALQFSALRAAAALKAGEMSGIWGI